MADVLKSTGRHSPPPLSNWQLSPWWRLESRRDVAKSVLRILHLAERESLPVIPLLRSLAMEHRYISASRISRLAVRLEQGEKVDTALATVPNLLSDAQTLQLRVAAESGGLSQAYEELAHTSEDTLWEPQRLVLQSLFYALVVGITCMGILGLIMTLIAPTFKEMFEEFGLDLPAPFISLIYFSDLFLPNFPLLVLGLVALAGVAWVLKPTRVLNRVVLSRLSSNIRRIRIANIQIILADSLREGRPIAGTVSTLARYHYDSFMRSKLLFVRNELGQNVSPWSALASVGFLAPREVSALAKTDRSDVQSLILRCVAQRNESRAQKKLSFMSMFIHPLLILCLAVVIGWVCIGFFSVLVVMISSLA